MSLKARFAARTPEEAARRRFGLWAGLSLIVLLPLWWLWGADAMAGLLRPLVGVFLGLCGLTGRIEVADGDWSIGTHLTQAGRAVDYPMAKENLRRLLLGFPLVAAFMLAPPRVRRPWRAAGLSIVVLTLVFAVCIAMTVWGELAVVLNPDLGGPGMTVTTRLDQPPLNPLIAQVVIIGRYLAQSIAPLLAALLLWATLNEPALKTLVAEFSE